MADPIFYFEKTDPLWTVAREAANREDWVTLVSAWKALTEKGIPGLCSSIGETYERGQPGISRDFLEAVRWYQRGVEDDDVKSHVALGRCYLAGRGVRQDFDFARLHLEKAFLAGSDPAAVYLGKIYYLGLGVFTDAVRVKRYLEPLLGKGYVSAHFILAKLYQREGRTIKSITTRLKGYMLGIRMVRENPDEPRLF